MTLKAPCLATLLALLPALTVSGPATAEEAGASDLAKELANPISNLISLPFQFNWDEGYGLDGDGERLGLNIQPVIPMSISEDWNLISRTIVPVLHQDGFGSDGGSETGLGDTVQSFFFSPKKPTSGGTPARLHGGHVQF